MYKIDWKNFVIIERAQVSVTVQLNHIIFFYSVYGIQNSAVNNTLKNGGYF